MTKSLLTHSRLNTARTCMRKHYLRYELGIIAPDEESEALAVGTVFHKAKEWTGLGKPDADVSAMIHSRAPSPLWAVIIERLWWYHHWYYSEQKFETIDTERWFCAPLINPETDRKSGAFDMAGVIDGVVKLPDERVGIREYKTTASDISPDSRYWDQARMSTQTLGYVINAGQQIDVILFDVVKKPGIRPKKVAKKDVPQLQLGLYCGASVSAEDWVQASDDGRETLEMYGARLSVDITSRPEHYFQLREFPVIEAELNEFKRDLWSWGQILKDAARKGWHPKNPSACLNFGACQYLGLCSAGIVPEGDDVPAGFVKMDNVHPELEGDQE